MNETQESGRLRSQRIRVEDGRAVVLTLAGERRRFTVEAISRTGALVVGYLRLFEGELIRLTLEMGTGTPLTLDAEVKNIAPVELGRFAASIVFHDIGLAQRLQLASLLEALAVTA